MGEYIDGVSEVIKKSVNKKLWLYFGVLSIPLILVYLIEIFILFFAVAGPLLSKLSDLPSLLSVLPGYFATGIFLMVAFFFLNIFIDSFLNLGKLTIARDVVKGKAFTLGEALSVPMGRAFLLFLVNILIAFAWLLITALLMFPSIQQGLDVFSSLGNLTPELMTEMMTWMQGVNNGLNMVQNLQAAVSILIVPILWSLLAVIAFEKLGFLDSISRAIKLGTKKYFSSLAYFLIASFALLGVAIVWLIVFIILLIIGALLLAVFWPLALLLGVILLIYCIGFILWADSFVHLAIVKLYLTNSVNQ